ncbi:uncharacterized protein LOC6524771 isoform X1 [Drosophila yakuba]|uniref:Uncharacterized protein n=1 Tax=Drosophila yakuba TaxID=7245 RepID=B4PW92_DROYA|nr:uncharacterized protein LOC6524771 isoform X1 [Drosophila yakuba]XP_039232143.1 uncharacterized protein LOC6524771 isoform X1 [Drosophila yakuba]EDX01723.1 uncharacterized protein Dyak_GE16078 [Drosophila yakuba]
MHTLVKLDDVVSHIWHTYLKVILNYETFSIWNFPTNLDGKTMLAGPFVCTSEAMFPYIFYYILGISVIGVLHNFIELINLSFARLGTHQVRMWRPRTITNFRDKQLRRFRIVGTIIMFKAWALLLYAMITIQPNYMTFWVMIFGTAITIDTFFWTFDVLLWQVQRQRSWLILLFPLTNFYCVLCVRATLKQLIEHYGTRDLVWWT